MRVGVFCSLQGMAHMGRVSWSYVTTCAAVSLLFVLAGCLGPGHTPIGEIVDDPGNYAEKAVSVKGQVTDVMAVPMLTEWAAYRIENSTGSIWVVTRAGAPPTGETVVVKGRVKVALRLGTKNLGVGIMESKRSK